MEPLCLWCKHFSIEPGSPGYSDATPGWSARIECRKNVWDFDMDDDGETQFRRVMHTAKTCKFYKLSSEIEAAK